VVIVDPLISHVLSWKRDNSLDMVKYEEVYLRAYSDGWEAELPMRSILISNHVPPARG
jgi:hypothetical protein